MRRPLLWLTCVLWACGPQPLEDGGVDASVSLDAGGADAGSTDAGSPDAGGTDAGGTDAGSADAGDTDAGDTDAGDTDAGGTDAGGADAGGSDAGAPDAGIPPVFAQCGNGVCEPQETQACADCVTGTASCGNGTCEFGETSNQCASDCRPLRTDGGFALALPDLGAGRWKNYVGGLYPGGSNTLPADHLAAGLARARAITPRDVDGQPSPGGKIVMISIGMSNTTQEFCAHNGVDDTQAAQCRPWSISGRARDDAEVRHGTLTLVNGARGGMSIENWTSTPVAHAVPANSACLAGGYANPNNAALYPNTPQGNDEKRGVFGPNLAFDEEYDRVAACNLKANGLSYRQVQVAWVKLSRADPTASTLPDTNADAYNLKRDLGDVMRTLKQRFPNLQQVFLSSRVWGGFSGASTAEPFSFETGLAVKWLIEAQLNQVRNGGVSVERATAPGYSGDLDYTTGVAPWLAWGPYLWANANQPTSGDATWFADVAGGLYGGTLAAEQASAAQTLTLPAANAGQYYVSCGAGPRGVAPGPQDGLQLNRWCDSDFFTLLSSGQRANAGTTTFGWGSDFLQEDGTHPTHDGEAKVGSLGLRFFKTSPVTACWFLANGVCP